MKLFLGTCNEEFVKKLPQDAVLITEDCWPTIKKDLPQIAYTGIEEFSTKNKSILLEVIAQASEVHLLQSQDDSFDLEFPIDSASGYLEYLVRTSDHPNVHGLAVPKEIIEQKTKFLKLADQRHTDKSQLWFAGCSITYGIGVSPDERFTHLIANSLNVTPSVLAVSGGSIAWNANQIVRSDLRPGDTLVWCLSTKERMTIVYNNNIYHVTNQAYKFTKNYPWLPKYLPLKLLSNQGFSVYRTLTNIDQVVKFCQKIGVNLLLIDFFTDPISEFYLTDLPNYYATRRTFDLGTDDLHPGPITHKFFAEFIMQKLLDHGFI